jgi:hypothetical protein
LEKKVFSMYSRGTTEFWGPKKPFFRYGSRDFKFLFLGELGTCPQNLMPIQGVEP